MLFRSLLFGSLAALRAVFSFLHIRISLVYCSSMSGEVIYGQPWRCDKLIYNREASAPRMSSFVPPAPVKRTAPKVICVSVHLFVCKITADGKEFTGWWVSSPAGTGERKRGGQKVSTQTSRSWFRWWLYKKKHLLIILSSAAKDNMMTTFLVLFVSVCAGVCLFSVGKMAHGSLNRL